MLPKEAVDFPSLEVSKAKSSYAHVDIYTIEHTTSISKQNRNFRGISQFKYVTTAALLALQSSKAISAVLEAEFQWKEKENLNVLVVPIWICKQQSLVTTPQPSQKSRVSVKFKQFWMILWKEPTSQEWVFPTENLTCPFFSIFRG